MPKLFENSSYFLRQLEIANPLKFRHSVTILGVGSVGSASALALGKMGLRKVTLIDFDVFEPHNVANQLCFESLHLGKPKVEGIAGLLKSMAPPGLEVETHQMKLEGSSLVSTSQPEKKKDARSVLKGILINCPDDMKARADAWEIAKLNPQIPYVIDVRMAAQFLKMYLVSTMDLRQAQRYEKSLHSNKEASEDPCGQRAIIYTTLVAGALVAKFVKSLQLGECVPEEFEMDLHQGTTLQLLKGRQVASREEYVTALFSN
jgi:hypothetical protein